MIKQLMWEVNQLKRELARMKAEDQMVMESLHNRVRDLEMELNELRQIADINTSVRSSPTRKFLIIANKIILFPVRSATQPGNPSNSVNSQISVPLAHHI